MKTYNVTVGAEADSLEETFRVKAKTAKAAEFDAKLLAAKAYPFVDPQDLLILRTEEAK